MNLVDYVQLTGWPTPAANEFETTDPEAMLNRREQMKSLGINGNGFGLTLGMLVSGWPTARAEDAESSGARLKRGVSDTLTEMARLTGWATPAERDYRYPNQESHADRRDKAEDQLNNQAPHLTGWDTPTVMEANKLTPNSKKGVRHQLLGRNPSSSSAETGKPAASVLNPAMSRWLMGFPRRWDVLSPRWQSWRDVQEGIASGAFAAMEMPLFRDLPPCSSAP
jgi:hypothetical protein